MIKTYYQLVTNDKFEFPLSLPMKAKELAAILGIREDTVRFYGTQAYQRKIAKFKTHNRKKNGYKVVRLRVDFDNDEEDD